MIYIVLLTSLIYCTVNKHCGTAQKLWQLRRQKYRNFKKLFQAEVSTKWSMWCLLYNNYAIRVRHWFSYKSYNIIMIISERSGEYHKLTLSSLAGQQRLPLCNVSFEKLSDWNVLHLFIISFFYESLFKSDLNCWKAPYFSAWCCRIEFANYHCKIQAVI